ncbi:DUF819 family protein [candidate division KSB1 bacterium]|nr:DUF819 family protein [candidate division KSB1 bacterium]
MALFSNSLLIIAVLCGNIVVSELLVRKTFLRHIGTALLVILVTAVTSNIRLIPTNSLDAPIYDAIFQYIAPLAIFLLLLEVNLRTILKAGTTMLFIFLIGSFGTVAGVVIGMMVINGRENIGELYNGIAGMFTGTYTGGSINFNAIALHYGVARDGLLYTGSVVVDNILTTIWMIVSIAAPKILVKFRPNPVINPNSGSSDPAPSVKDFDTETLDPLMLGVLIGSGLAAIWFAETMAALLSAAGIAIPSILILTSIALALAQIPAVNRLKGKKVLGMFAVYLFLSVIGAFCDFGALISIGSLGVTLLILASVTVTVHGLITYAGGALFKIDWDIVSIASQANVGGSTSALALARSLDRGDLILPAILVGSLGYGLGTYLGFMVAEFIVYS